MPSSVPLRGRVKCGTKWKRDCYTTDLVTGPRESERKRERESTLLKSKLACPGKENDSEKW